MLCGIPRRIRIVHGGEYDHLFRNDGDKFVDVSEKVGLLGTDQGLAASWFDYDEGDPDLYVQRLFGPDRFYRNDNGRFTDITSHALPHVPWFSMGTDVEIDNDGLLDFMGTDMAGSDHFKSKIGMGDMENPTGSCKPPILLNTCVIPLSKFRNWQVP